MNSFNWKEIIGDKKHFTDIPADVRGQFKTERQWAKLGFVAVNDSCGELLWANCFHANQYIYLHESEVAKATREKLDTFFADEKKRRRESAAKQREKRAQEARDQEAQRLEVLAQKDSMLDALNAELTQAKASFKKLSQLYAAVADPVGGFETVENVVLDTETTGVTADDELLQVSILSADTGAVLYNSYIKPCVKVAWAEAQAINGISPEMVKDAPCIFEVLPKLNAIFRNVKNVIGYNLNFDMVFLEDAGVKLPADVAYHDVMETFAVVCGDYSTYHGSFRWQKLTVCAEELGYDWGEDAAHDSLADCKATLFCYNELQKEKYVAKYEENLRMAAELENNPDAP